MLQSQVGLPLWLLAFLCAEEDEMMCSSVEKGGGEFYTYISNSRGDECDCGIHRGVSRLRYNETYAQTGRIVPSPIHLLDANLSRKLHGGNKQIHTRQLFCNFSDFYVPIRDLG